MRQYVIPFGIAVVIFLGLTFGIDRFLDQESGKNWPAAIQGSSTVILVAITTFYAIFTRQLVRTQQMDIRRRDEVPIVHKMLASVGTLELDSQIFHLGHVFPIDHAGPPDRKVIATIEPRWLDQLQADISGLVPVLPEALRHSGQAYLTACAAALRQTKLLSGSIHHELDLSSGQGRAFDWTSARLQFSTLRDDLPEGERPEWEEVLRGSAITNLQNEHRSMIPKLRAYLSDPGG